MKTLITTLILLIVSCNTALGNERIIEIKREVGTLEGTLALPEIKGDAQKDNKSMVALIIAGSGPTDRNGNSPATQNNALKYLAAGLQAQGIASLRYDKRGVGKSVSASVKESDLRFEHYIDDAKAWVKFLSDSKQFQSIIIIGHSEGALIGSIASQDEKVSKFVSIAGAGVSADQILRDQLKSQSAYLQQQAKPIIEKLSQGEVVEHIHPATKRMFRPSIQPYLISWFKYDPSVEIKKLNKPVLIIQGDNDIQISVNDAKKLDQASPQSQLVIIENMNHILKESEKDRQKNLATYRQPELPISPKVIETVKSFLITPKS